MSDEETVVDAHGRRLEEGQTVSQVGEPAQMRVVEITGVDGDVDDEGRSYGIAPRVIVEYPDGERESFVTGWAGLRRYGPPDGDEMAFECDDLELVLYGLRIQGVPLGIPAEVVGDWMQTFDYDIHAPGRPYPTGNGGSTEDPDKAMSFPTMELAWEAWRRPSEVTPTRPDGRPNRPMTVFTISVERLR
jgi:hypothetical protein